MQDMHPKPMKQTIVLSLDAVFTSRTRLLAGAVPARTSENIKLICSLP
jgi:hypothetical protein